MDTEQISTRIEQLVDILRAEKSAPTLGDVAGVTEVLLATMRKYFNSLDISLYEEMRQLSDHITRARTEIAELKPSDLKEHRIPRAGKELEAIVQSTEEATGTIMDAAEEIMSADNSDADAYKQVVDDACMRIFEACSFQDITGQRITKVVSTLTHIEERLNCLQTAWGPDIDDAEGDDAEPDEVIDRQDEVKAGLLNGPALEGEGIDQSAVDNLFSGDEPAAAADADTAMADEAAAETPADADTAPVEAPEAGQDAAAEAESEPEPETEAAEAAAADEPEAAEKKKPAKKAPVEDVGDELAAASEEVSQAEIDALFD